MTLTEKQLADKLRKKGMVGSDKAIVSAYLKKNPDHAKFINNNPGLKLDASSALNTRSSAISNAVKTSYKPTSKPSGQYNKYVSKQTTNSQSYNPKPATSTSMPKKAEKPKLSDIKTYGIEEADRRLKLYKQQEAAEKYAKAKRFEQEHPVLNFAYESFIPYGDYSIYNKNRNKRFAESNINEQPTIKQLFKNTGTDIVNRAIPYANLASFAVGGGAGNIAKGVNAGVKAAASSTKLASNANKIVKSLEAADKAIRTPVARQMVTGAKHSGTIGGIFGVTDAANSNLNRDGNLSEFITKPLVYGGAGAIGGALNPALNAGVAAAGATDNILANLATGLLGGAVDASALATGDYYLHLTPEERAQRSLQEQILEYLPFAGLGAINAAPSALKGVRGAIKKSATNIKNPGIANTIADTASTLGESLEGMPGQYQKLGEILSEQQRPIELRRTPEEQAYINQTQGMSKNNETVFKKNVFEGTDAARRYQEAQEKPTFTQDVPPEEPTYKYTDPNAEANRAFMELEEGLEPGTIERTETKRAVENAPEGETIQHTNTGSIVEPTEPPVSNVSNTPQQKIRIDQEKPLKTNSARSELPQMEYTVDEIMDLLNKGYTAEQINKALRNEDLYIKPGQKRFNAKVKGIERLEYVQPKQEEQTLPFLKEGADAQYESYIKPEDKVLLVDIKNKSITPVNAFENGKFSDKYRVLGKTKDGVVIVRPSKVKERFNFKKSAVVNQEYNNELGNLQNKVKAANSKYLYKPTQANWKRFSKLRDKLNKFKEDNKTVNIDELRGEGFLPNENETYDKYNDSSINPEVTEQENSKYAKFVTTNEEYIDFYNKYKSIKSKTRRKNYLNREIVRQAKNGTRDEFLDFLNKQEAHDNEVFNKTNAREGIDTRKESTDVIADINKDLPKNSIKNTSAGESQRYKGYKAKKFERVLNHKVLPDKVDVHTDIDSIINKHIDGSLVGNTPETLQRYYDNIIDRIEETPNITPQMRKSMIDQVNDIANKAMKERSGLKEGDITLRDYDVNKKHTEILNELENSDTKTRRSIIDRNNVKHIKQSEYLGKQLRRAYHEHNSISAAEANTRLKELIANKKFGEAKKLLDERENVIYNDVLHAYDNNNILEFDRNGRLVEKGDIWDKKSSNLDEGRIKAQEVIDNYRKQIDKGLGTETYYHHYSQRKYLGEDGVLNYEEGKVYNTTLNKLGETLSAQRKDVADTINSFVKEVGDIKLAQMPLDSVNGQKLLSNKDIHFKSNTLYINPKTDITSAEFGNALKQLKETLMSNENIYRRPWVDVKFKGGKEVPAEIKSGKFDGTNPYQATIDFVSGGEGLDFSHRNVSEVKRALKEQSKGAIDDALLAQTKTGLKGQVSVLNSIFGTDPAELANKVFNVSDFADALSVGDSAIADAIRELLPDSKFKLGKIKGSAKGNTDLLGNITLDLNNAGKNKFQLFKSFIHEVHHNLYQKFAEMCKAVDGDTHPVWVKYQEGLKANEALQGFRKANPDAWEAYKFATENGLSYDDIAKVTKTDINLIKEADSLYQNYQKAGIEVEANLAKKGVWQFNGTDIGAFNDVRKGFEQIQRGQGVHSGGTVRVSGTTSGGKGQVSEGSKTDVRGTGRLEDISINPDRTRANVSGMPFANLKDAQMYEMNRAAKNEAELAIGHVARKLSKEREGVLRKWDIYTQEQIDNRKKMMGVKRRPVKDSKGNVVLDENGSVKYKYEGVFVSQRRNKGEVNVSDKSNLKSREKVAKVAREAKRRGLKNLSPDEIMRNVIDDHIEIKALDKLMDTVVEMSEDYNGKSTPKGYEAYNEKLLAYCKYANLSRDAYNAVLKGPETIKKTFAKERQLCNDLLEQYNRNSEATKVVPSNVIDKILSYNNETAKMASRRYGRWSWPTVSKVIEETSRAVTDPFKQAVLSTVGFIAHNRVSNYHQILANSKNPTEAGRNWFKAWQTSNEAIPSELIDNNLVEAVRAYSEAPKTYTGFTEFDAVANLFGGHLIDDSTLGKVINVMDRRGRIKAVKNKKYNPLKYHSVKAANTFTRFIQAPFAKFANSMMKFNSVFEAHERKWVLLNEMPKVRKDILKATGQQITLVDEALKHIKGNKQLEALVVKRVEDILGDYRNFSPAEKKITKQLVPFVSWFKAATRMNYKLFKKNPSRWLMLQANEHKKRSEDETKGIKEFQQGSIPVEVNGKKYRSNLSNYTAINYLREVKDGGDILQSMNPHVQNIIETSRGKKIFGDGHIESKRYKYIPFGEHKGKYIDTKTDKIIDSLPVLERLKYMGVKAARTHILGNKLVDLEGHATAAVHALQGKGYKLPDKMYDTSFGGYYDGDVINGYKRNAYMPRPDEIKLINKTGAGLQPEYPLNKKEKEKLLEKIKKQKEKQNKRKKAS